MVELDYAHIGTLGPPLGKRPLSVQIKGSDLEAALGSRYGERPDG